LEDAIRQLQAIHNLSATEIFIHIVDIGLVAFLLYRLLLLVRGTRAWRILLGVLAFLVVLSVADRLELHTLHWILEKATILGPVALVILFLPELRQAIEGFGKFSPLGILELAPNQDHVQASVIEEIISAISELQQESVGALVVIEKAAKLDEIAANGVQLDAVVSSPLLSSIFYGENPLHDGAVVIRGDKVLAAACRLPLSESTHLDSHVHMRHRAAVGITEATDVVAIVVSEERGTISVAQDGALMRLSGPNELRETLNRELRQMPQSTPHVRRNRRERKSERESKKSDTAKRDEVAV
jgi:diadenylate cyclase